MTEASTVPAVPGFWRFTWLFFMQPTKLHELFKLWDVKTDTSLLRLRHRLHEPLGRAVVTRLVSLLFGSMPVLTVSLAGLMQMLGLPVDWDNILISVFAGIIFGVFVGVFGQAVGGVVLGVIFGVLGGIVFGVGVGVFGQADGAIISGVLFGVLGGVLFGVFVGISAEVSGVSVRVSEGVGGGVFLGVFVGVVIGVDKSWLEGVASSVFCISTYLLLYFRLLVYILEAFLMAILAFFQRVVPGSHSRLASFLPFRHHDFIYIELPMLRSFLVDLADENENLASDLIAEAARSVGQKRAARLALIELQSRSLENAARQRLYARAAELDLPFLGAEEEGAFRPFQAAAADLRAATTSGQHLHRHRALERAEKVLVDAQLAGAGTSRRDRRAQRLAVTLKTWLDVVREEQTRLAQEERENPQVPVPFVAGPALSSKDRDLFRGRVDLVRMIDHDLTGDRRAPILLFGQRRMGKSSLLSMLPVQLGTGTRVVTLNFQGLSGSPHRSHPERWIAAAITEAWPDAPARLDAEAWGEVLTWLREVDAALRQADQRLLVALDEVERLEDGIREGWATTDLLDLVRASGDALHRVRFLLATAYALPRLGPHWVDRLINVLPRQIRPLSAAEATSLVRAPMPGFPDIYPDGGVERIVDATAGHPYLVQLTCDVLCRHLNEDRRLEATSDDVETAIDRALLETPLFDELWRQRSEDERRVLGRVASGEDAPTDVERLVVRGLEREDYLVRREGRLVVTVPMFGDWIVENT